MVSRLEGAGGSTGQPGRIDFDGREHLERLQPGSQLQIEQGSVSETRNNNRKPVDGWRRQESVLSEQSHLRADRSGDWSKFSGGGRKGRQLGQVAIDGPHDPTLEKAPSFSPDELKNGAWADQAAHFEERSRQNQPRLGNNGEPSLPPITVSSATGHNGPGNPKNNRRTFTVG